MTARTADTVALTDAQWEHARAMVEVHKRAAWALWRDYVVFARSLEEWATVPDRDPGDAARCAAHLRHLAASAAGERRAAAHYAELAATREAPAGSSWDPRAWGLPA